VEGGKGGGGAVLKEQLEHLALKEGKNRARKGSTRRGACGDGDVSLFRV